MMTYSATTAWLVTCISGLLTGVILGSQTQVSFAAFLGVTLSIGAAIITCTRVLRAPAA